MTTPNALRALADRVEAGENGREIDAEVMAQFYRRGERHIGVYDDATDEPVMSDVWIDPATDKWVGTHAREFTSSLDAVEALRVRLVPLSRWVCVRHRFKDDGNVSWTFHAALFSEDGAFPVTVSGNAPTEPLARLAAALRAYAAQIEETSNAGN